MTKRPKVRVYIFRHGETEWNAAKRIQGHIDIPLNERGRAQADELAVRLSQYELQAIVSSDLSRAKSTGSIVARHLKIPIYIEPRFREVSLGEVEGLLVSEVILRFGDATWQTWRSMNDADFDFKFPGGESKREALVRVRAGINDIIETHRLTRIGIAAHGAIMRALVHSMLPDGTVLISVQNCDLHVIQRDQDMADSGWEYVAL